MTITHCTIRTMQASDLADVLAIQDVCYVDIVPESETSLQAKLHASPMTCFVACIADRVVGYVIAVPWTLAAPPELDSPECRIPETPDCLYLHDLAVLPEARKTGAGSDLVRTCLECLPVLSLQHACLIAIQASSAYWRRHGFTPADIGSTLKHKLASYGDRVVYMEYRA